MKPGGVQREDAKGGEGREEENGGGCPDNRFDCRATSPGSSGGIALRGDAPSRGLDKGVTMRSPLHPLHGPEDEAMALGDEDETTAPCAKLAFLAGWSSSLQFLSPHPPPVQQGGLDVVKRRHEMGPRDTFSKEKPLKSDRMGARQDYLSDAPFN